MEIAGNGLFQDGFVVADHIIDDPYLLPGEKLVVRSSMPPQITRLIFSSMIILQRSSGEGRSMMMVRGFPAGSPSSTVAMMTSAVEIETLGDKIALGSNENLHFPPLLWPAAQTSPY